MNPSERSVGPSGRVIPTPVAGVVFDCDGLLVDSESQWLHAEAGLFAEHGLAFGPVEQALLFGGSTASSAVLMADCFGRPDDAEAIEAALLERIRVDLKAGVQALPGAREIVQACRARVPVAVASNSPRDLLDLALVGAGLAELLPISIAADEVQRPKPDPELYLTACERMGVDPGQAVAFEDSRTGAAAARAAGLFVVTVPSHPDVQPDYDRQFASLAEDGLLAWVSSWPV